MYRDFSYAEPMTIRINDGSLRETRYVGQYVSFKHGVLYVFETAAGETYVKPKASFPVREGKRTQPLVSENPRGAV